MNLRQAALEVLCLTVPAHKAAQARALYASLPAEDTVFDTQAVYAEPASLPGRPERPRLVPPKQVAARSPFTLEGRAALLHAIAHIEFNAIKIGVTVDISPAEHLDGSCLARY